MARSNVTRTMSNVTATAVATPVEERRRAREPWKLALRARGILQDQVAVRARVTRPAVVRWFAGHFDSQKIERGVKAMISTPPRARRK